MKINTKALFVAMAENQMNFGQLAKKSGVCRSTIDSLRAGNNCSPATVGAIAKALDKNVSELLED